MLQGFSRSLPATECAPSPSTDLTSIVHATDMQARYWPPSVVAPRSPCLIVGRNGSTLSCALFVLAVLLVAYRDRDLRPALYLLSFWHYYLYWLAFTFGAIDFGVFKRDAVAMKTVSVAALAIVYLRTPLDVASLAVIAGGILLNIRAAQALGFDRTYYGHEVAGLPPRRMTAFPYSLTAHPMILGNVAAFGGTLINADFREQWWPLAGLHVALNVGLVVMELAGPRRRHAVRIGGSLVMAGALLAALFWLADLLLVAAALACAGVLFRCYTAPPQIARNPP
jgi:hypothetical protein